MSAKGREKKDDRYAELAEKLMKGTITPGEERELMDWYDDDEQRTIQVPAGFAADEDRLKDRIAQKINSRLAPKQRSLFSPAFYRIAAVAILLAGAALFLFRRYNERPQPIADVRRQKAPARVDTATGHAVLTLADGTEVVLDDTKNGMITRQGDTRVIRLQGGRLAYRPADSAGAGAAASAAYNTITTPQEVQYQVILPDNTQVWLNASSSLRFPIAFNSRERTVQLKGEAYFEVAPSLVSGRKVPFRVQAQEVDVLVLGTHFNIAAYQADTEIKTTLMEGSVRVGRGASHVVLKPGEQGSLKKKEGTLQVNKGVNTRQILAWKNGEFYFEDTNIKDVMAQIGQWYDLTVVYEEAFSNVGFSGIILRRKEVAEVLEILEVTHKVRFKLEGRKVTVSRFKNQ